MGGGGGRPHWALVPESVCDPVTPEEVYRGRVKPKLTRWQGWAKAAREKPDKRMQPSTVQPDVGEHACVERMIMAPVIVARWFSVGNLTGIDVRPETQV